MPTAEYIKRYRSSAKGREATNRAARNYARKAQGCEAITDRQCAELLEMQGGKCKVCGKMLNWPNKNTHVDHDHETGKVRGILCHSCNTLIGRIEAKHPLDGIYREISGERLGFTTASDSRIMRVGEESALWITDR